MITILGPTATGKTQVAVGVAQKLDAEIISADSRQVYRRMDIGTGKDLGEYEDVLYHLIDICEPGTKYDLFRYQTDFKAAYDDIYRRGKEIVLCGGTGLYIESILKGYNLSPVPQNQELRDTLADKSLEELTSMLLDLKRKNGSNTHNSTDVDTTQRAIRAIEIETYNLSNPLPERPFNSYEGLVFGIDVPREVRRERISKRLRSRLDEGMVDEVQKLLDGGIPAEDLIYYGLEYKYLTLYCIGELPYEEMVRLLEIAIHQFAKRQMTWFRGMERRGTTIHWIDGTLPLEERVAHIYNIYKEAQEG